MGGRRTGSGRSSSRVRQPVRESASRRVGISPFGPSPYPVALAPKVASYQVNCNNVIAGSGPRHTITQGVAYSGKRLSSAPHQAVRGISHVQAVCVNPTTRLLHKPPVAVTNARHAIPAMQKRVQKRTQRTGHSKVHDVVYNYFCTECKGRPPLYGGLTVNPQERFRAHARNGRLGCQVYTSGHTFGSCTPN